MGGDTGATGAVGAGFCTACLDNRYPVEVPVNLRKNVLEKNEMPADGLQRLLHEAEKRVGLLADLRQEEPPGSGRRFVRPQLS